DSFSRFMMMRAEEQDVDTVFIGFAAPGMWALCPSVDGSCIAKISDEEMRRRFFEELFEHVQRLKMHGKRVIISLPFPSYDKSIPDLQVRNAVLRKFRLVTAAKEATPTSVRDQV